MEKIKTDGASGVEIMHDGYHKPQAGNNAAWALGGAVVGAAVGATAVSSWKKNHHDGDRNHHGGSGHYGGYPPYYGCSENTPVNRFELKQAECLASKDAEIGMLKAEKYTDNKTQEANAFMMQYVDRMVGKVSQEVECLEKEFCHLDKKEAINEERLACLNSDFAGFKRQTAEQFHAIRGFVEHEIKEEHDWARKEFIHQPKVKACVTDVTFQGCCNTTTTDTTTEAA